LRPAKNSGLISETNRIFDMLIIEVKNGETIDKALRRYKRKSRDTKVIKELRSRKQFTKPSVKRRAEKLKAVYKQQKQRSVDN
jgi:small subunit ribosomal protein S21